MFFKIRVFNTLLLPLKGEFLAFWVVFLNLFYLNIWYLTDSVPFNPKFHECKVVFMLILMKNRPLKSGLNTFFVAVRGTKGLLIL